MEIIVSSFNYLTQAWRLYNISIIGMLKYPSLFFLELGNLNLNVFVEYLIGWNLNTIYDLWKCLLFGLEIKFEILSCLFYLLLFALFSWQNWWCLFLFLFLYMDLLYLLNFFNLWLFCWLWVFRLLILLDAFFQTAILPAINVNLFASVNIE